MRLGRRARRETPPAADTSRAPARFNFARDVVEALARDPNRPAMTYVDPDGVIERVTFRSVAVAAARWSALLRARGLKPGDRLLVVLERAPAWHEVILGAFKAGLVAVPCAPSLPAGEIERRAREVGARLVVHSAVGDVALGAVETVSVGECAAERGALDPFQPTHDSAAADVALLLFTDGTTGPVRAVAHTHGHAWAARVQAEHWVDARPGDLVWCTAPAGAPMAVWNTLLGPWSTGAEVVVHEGDFDPEGHMELVQRLGVTVLCQPAGEYRALADVQAPAAARAIPRHAVSYGGPLSQDVQDAFRRSFGIRILEGYGQVECGIIVANTPSTQGPPGSIGTALPGLEVAVLGPAGSEQPAGIEGELALRGRPPSLFSGYWDASDETSAAFRSGWYRTGDRAWRDEDGFFWLAARNAVDTVAATPAVIEAESEIEVDAGAVVEPAGAGAALAAPGATDLVTVDQPRSAELDDPTPVPEEASADAEGGGGDEETGPAANEGLRARLDAYGLRTRDGR